MRKGRRYAPARLGNGDDDYSLSIFAPMMAIAC
jgi:hypothetical protein